MPEACAGSAPFRESENDSERGVGAQAGGGARPPLKYSQGMLMACPSARM